MFSNIENVNILTSVLKSHGVRRVVVCPGSRNAPLVHNFNELEDVTCYPVTDERSAGFFALGLAMGDPSPCPSPIAVCVTSGSALLNVFPAVAEAFYQKLPVIVISADRPEAWIEQQDGQTLPQANVFGGMVNKRVNLPVIPPAFMHNDEAKRLHDEQAWYCERMVHEAVLDCAHRRIGPVHINIQIAEPLYQFTTEKLPATRWLDYVHTNLFGGTFHYGDMLDFLNARKPMIVVGQDYPATSLYGIKDISSWAVTLIEPTALGTNSKEPARRDLSYVESPSSFEEVLYKVGEDETYMPDFILYVGGTIVSKRLKQFLRKAAAKEGTKVWRASKDGECIDTFMHLDRIFHADPDLLASAMTDYDQKYKEEVDEYKARWENALMAAKRHAYSYQPEFSSMAVVAHFQKEYLANAMEATRSCRLFYGNSMPIRLAGIYARQYVHCNRGVNGIEGTLSAAAGLSVYMSERHDPDARKQQKVFCVLGDLSFFYDQNALWNQNLNGSLRIILLNNGGGAIFGKFDGLKNSKARERLVMAEHQTSAVAVCQAYDIEYMGVDNMKAVRYGIDQLIHTESDRPMLLEVFTDIDTDNRVLEEYFKDFKI